MSAVDPDFLRDLDVQQIRMNGAREKWGLEVDVENRRAGAVPPRRLIAADVGVSEPRCTSAQHVWAAIPHSWVCECGEMEVVDAGGVL